MSSTTSNVTIASQPTANSIGVDTGIADTGVNSLTFSSSLTAGITFVAAGVEELDIFTNVTNNSGFPIQFNLPVTLNSGIPGTEAYSTGGGLFFAGGLNAGLSAITASGTGSITLSSTAYTTIAIASGSSYGALVGSAPVNYNGTNLQFELSSSTQTVGTSWQVFAVTSGTVGSVSFVGDNVTGALSQISPGVLDRQCRQLLLGI